MGEWSSGKWKGDQACINTNNWVQNPLSGHGEDQVQVLGDSDSIYTPLTVQ